MSESRGDDEDSSSGDETPGSGGGGSGPEDKTPGSGDEDPGPGDGSLVLNDNNGPGPAAHARMMHRHDMLAHGKVTVATTGARVHVPAILNDNGAQSSPADKNFVTAPSQQSRRSQEAGQPQPGPHRPIKHDSHDTTGTGVAQIISSALSLRPLTSTAVQSELERIQHDCLRVWLQSPAARIFFKLVSSAGAKASKEAPICILCVGQYHNGLSEPNHRPAKPLLAGHIRDGGTKAVISHIISHNQELDVRAIALHQMITNISWLGKFNS